MYDTQVKLHVATNKIGEYCFRFFFLIYALHAEPHRRHHRRRAHRRAGPVPAHHGPTLHAHLPALGARHSPPRMGSRECRLQEHGGGYVHGSAGVAGDSVIAGRTYARTRMCTPTGLCFFHTHASSLANIYRHDGPTPTMTAGKDSIFFPLVNCYTAANATDDTYILSQSPASSPVHQRYLLRQVPSPGGRRRRAAHGHRAQGRRGHRDDARAGNQRPSRLTPARADGDRRRCLQRHADVQGSYLMMMKEESILFFFSSISIRSTKITSFFCCRRCLRRISEEPCCRARRRQRLKSRLLTTNKTTQKSIPRSDINMAAVAPDSGSSSNLFSDSTPSPRRRARPRGSTRPSLPICHVPEHGLLSTKKSTGPSRSSRLMSNESGQHTTHACKLFAMESTTHTNSSARVNRRRARRIPYVLTDMRRRRSGPSST